jgi:tRNA G18 (ribose-2'-O)-methylase SpoU
VQITQIEDLSHELLRDYRDLTDVELRSTREPLEGLYIAESLKILERALRAGHRPRSILSTAQWLPKLEELASHLGDILEKTPVFIGEAELVERLTGYRVHRGTLASMHRPELPGLEDILRSATRLVVLEDIVDHTNVGAIFRSVAGIGADAVIVTDSCADPLYRRSIRVSMGTVFQIPWTRSGSWSDLESALHRHELSIVALGLTPDAIPLDTFAENPPAKLALVLGTEGGGLSARVLKGSDSIVSIPMHGGVDSLNVAAASAVALWALRNR